MYDWIVHTLYFRSSDSCVSIQWASLQVGLMIISVTEDVPEQKGIVISRHFKDVVVFPHLLVSSDALPHIVSLVLSEDTEIDGCHCVTCSKLQVVLSGTQVICIHLITKHRPMRSSMRGVRKIFLYHCIIPPPPRKKYLLRIAKVVLDTH